MMMSYCTVAMTTNLCDVISLESWQNWVTVVTHCLAWWSVPTRPHRESSPDACICYWLLIGLAYQSESWSLMPPSRPTTERRHKATLLMFSYKQQKCRPIGLEPLQGNLAYCQKAARLQKRCNAVVSRNTACLHSNLCLLGTLSNFGKSA